MDEKIIFSMNGVGKVLPQKAKEEAKQNKKKAAE